MRVLLVEDDDLTASTIAAILSSEGMSCDRVALGELGEARLLSARTAYDVAVIDRMLPRQDGIETIANLRAAGLRMPVLMISALARAAHRVEGLDGGADDYLSKPFEPEELVARLRALHRRAAGPVDEARLVHGDIELHLKARTAHRGDRHLKLSPKEWDILRLLMENAGQVVTRSMLLQQVWNLSFDPQTNVVDVNLVRLRRKLDDQFDQRWLETVRGHGYRLRALPEQAG